MSNYSPGIPSSFDPALLQSDFCPLDDAPPSSHAYELDAIAECAVEDKVDKSRRGIVIQHRAWNKLDAFRSEEDYPIDTPVKHHAALQRFSSTASSLHALIPSSPPLMPLISSPITYPASSAPQPTSPKKRKRTDADCAPLKDVPNNNTARRAGAFLDDSDDEDDIAVLKEHALKRRAINTIKDLPAIPDGVADYTPPASQEEFVDPETVSVGALDDYFKTPSPVKQPALAPEPPTSAQHEKGAIARTAAGRPFYIPKKLKKPTLSYEQLIASRSTGAQGQARQSYYGLNIHKLMDEAKATIETKAAQREKELNETPRHSVEQPVSGKAGRTLMWTEKYRAKKFTDLVGDERTHRSVLRWLKGWDPIVFPGASKQKPKSANKGFEEEEQKHRKILLLTGPPGLGKTTLAHVCARQAGYEVQEINASDERSKDVVKGRIRDMVGTENVRGITTNTSKGKVRKAGKPVCVVVDEVDGVVGGSGGSGEGGFVKALIDLINLDERNSQTRGQQYTTGSKKKKKGDNFRMLRPLILVCNDVYHPSLRPLRQSSLAEIIHIRKPALNMVISRVQDIFTREGIRCDSDAARRLCEATWGVSTKKEGGSGHGTGEGDIRGIMVVSEWVAGRFRNSLDAKAQEKPRLTRHWVEDNVTNDLSHGGGAARSLGRGGAKDVVDRVFREGAGFPKQAEATDLKTAAAQAKQGVIGVAEGAKRRAMIRLREMADTSGDCDRIVMDCFTAYPDKPFQDDTFLSKPAAAYEWLHFHDTLSSAVHGSQEWELAPYLSQSVLAFHNLFASPKQQSSIPIADPDAPTSAFSGPSANYVAFEQNKASRASLMGLQSTLSLPLTRLFRSPEELAIELIPYVLRMLSPDVKPVVINTGASGSKSAATASVRKASEKELVKRAVQAMAATGVRFERSKVEFDDAANRNGGWVFRMEPPLDSLAAFDTLAGRKDDKVRYAVRSVLETEWKKESVKIDDDARKRRGGHVDGDEAEEVKEPVNVDKAVEEITKAVKRDFFGRVIVAKPLAKGEKAKVEKLIGKSGDEGRTWVSFHEGFSNAVRKPVTIDELIRGL
ncbi:chromosome transmission fidelity protein 18 [Massarina eburnea CBS 473.64]|uniref:Chromosome transmission fidelity protein 18 n=1 Tax=Massarina eburnea CBS 473.64 TaxID=1395130 RepID=A0A6A6RZ11_9PLEO|nr:chromosome transmission fidelity protein 18 [Massarina eburnea CBS 473.64]